MAVREASWDATSAAKLGLSFRASDNSLRVLRRAGAAPTRFDMAVSVYELAEDRELAAAEVAKVWVARRAVLAMP